MSLFDRAKQWAEKAQPLIDKAAPHARSAVGKAGEQIDKRTGGKYHNTIEQVGQKVGEYADKRSGVSGTAPDTLPVDSTRLDTPPPAPDAAPADTADAAPTAPGTTAADARPADAPSTETATGTGATDAGPTEGPGTAADATGTGTADSVDPTSADGPDGATGRTAP
jgi:MT0933-like antitoxin protein